MMIWQAKTFKFVFPRAPLVMGILNLTPDSFSGDGLLRSPQKALLQAERMEAEGADLLDIGAESTRPGARPISAREETRRLLPVFKKIRKRLRIPLSVDTRNAATARAALEEGADIINDVSGLRKAPRLAGVVARYRAGLILMHSRGNPRTMSRENRYDDLAAEIVRELREGLRRARSAGVRKTAIAVDPGVGFSKRGAQNLELLRSIERFREIGYPICLGISRKSFMGEIAGGRPGERDFAATALHSMLIERGVNILRVHSVRAARQAVLITQAFLKE